jgi:DNA (cytosine-5)-methyltransferase 1
MNFLDLFSGAGGLSLGFVQAGWDCVGAVDAWPDAVATYRANFPTHRARLADLVDFRVEEFGVVPGTVDWVIGGPPCQGFSTIGKRVREDPRNTLVQQFAKVVRQLAPAGFLIENVVGLRDMKFVAEVRALFEALGYDMFHTVLRAADYGVPQLRHRIFFVGTQPGVAFRFPERSLSPENYVTVWDAIGDLPELRAGESADIYDKPARTQYQRRLRRGSRNLTGHEASSHPASLVRAISFIPDGGNRLAIPPRYQPRSGFHNSYSRLHSGSPAVAVTQNMGKPSGTRCIHPFQNRGLTAREGARLQGFPDTFRFLGGRTSQRLQVANAVSPILARTIAECLDVTNGLGQPPEYFLPREVPLLEAI